MDLVYGGCTWRDLAKDWAQRHIVNEILHHSNFYWVFIDECLKKVLFAIGVWLMVIRVRHNEWLPLPTRFCSRTHCDKNARARVQKHLGGLASSITWSYMLISLGFSILWRPCLAVLCVVMSCEICSVLSYAFHAVIALWQKPSTIQRLLWARWPELYVNCSVSNIHIYAAHPRQLISLTLSHSIEGDVSQRNPGLSGILRLELDILA